MYKYSKYKCKMNKMFDTDNSKLLLFYADSSNFDEFSGSELTVSTIRIVHVFAA